MENYFAFKIYKLANISAKFSYETILLGNSSTTDHVAWLETIKTSLIAN